VRFMSVCVSEIWRLLSIIIQNNSDAAFRRKPVFAAAVNCTFTSLSKTMVFDWRMTVTMHSAMSYMTGNRTNDLFYCILFEVVFAVRVLTLTE